MYKTYLLRRPGVSVLCTPRLRPAATARVGILRPSDSWVVTSVLELWSMLWTMWCHSYIKRVETCQSALCRPYRYWDYETQSDRKRETSKQSSRLCGSANSNIRLVHKLIPDFIRVLQLSLAGFSVFHVFVSKTPTFSYHNRLEAGVTD